MKAYQLLKLFLFMEKKKETDRTIFLFPENVGPHFLFKKKIKLK